MRGLLVGVWTYNAALDLAVLSVFAAVVLGLATLAFSIQE
jgi:hypothetical protein